MPSDESRAPHAAPPARTARVRRRFAALCAMALAGCASARDAPPAGTPAWAGPPDVRWEPIVCFEGDAAFERVKVGRPDASDPNPQIVGVDQAGRMVLVHFNGGEPPRAEVIYDNKSEMTGLAIGNVDAAAPGEEIYAGAYEPGQEDVGGCVLQAVVTPSGTKVRRIFTAGTYVHAIEVVPSGAPGQPTRLVCSTYNGELYVLTPTPGDGLWTSRLIHRDPPITDVKPKDPRPRVKDIALIRDGSGRAPHEIVAVWAGGRAVYADLDRESSARVIADEDGGWGRVCADGGTGAYACGYKGRIVRFTRAADGGFTQEVIDQQGVDSGLRGMVMGRFPLPGPGGGVANLATYGFNALCRAIVARNGAWDPVTLWKDIGRGHTQVAADLVPGNDADELVISGYSKRIVILVARASR